MAVSASLTAFIENMNRLIAPVMHAQYVVFPVSIRGYTTDQTYALNEVF